VTANMHVVASLPTGLMVEVDRTRNGLVDHLLREPLRVSNGELHLPAGPGLGIELDPAAVKRFALEDAKIPAGNYSDMVFGRGFYNPAEPYESRTAIA